MNTPQVLTQAVLFALMVASIVWVVRENRRFPDRFPLVAPLDPRFLALVVPWLLVLGGVFWLIVSQELIPKRSPLWFGTALSMVALGSIAALMGALAVLQRRLAAGWIIREDDQTLRLKLDDVEETVPLRPGSVVARFTPKNQWLRFDIAHGERTLQILVMVPLGYLNLAKAGEVAEFIGAPLGGSSRRFCMWMRPWIRPV